MRRIQRYHVLSVLGDLKAHPYSQVVIIGTLHVSNPLNRTSIWGSERVAKNQYGSTVFESWLKRCMDDGLVTLLENARIKRIRMQDEYQITTQDYDIQLTPKGRDCHAMEQIARSGDYDYYKKFDGSLDS